MKFNHTDKIVTFILVTNARFPLFILHSIGNFLGSILALIPSRRVATSRKNIQACFPELSPTQQNRLLRKSFRQTAKGLMEVGKLWLLPAEKNMRLLKRVSGEEHIAAAIERGKGVILASPHLGSWELAGSYVSSKYPLTTMYQKPPIKGLSKLIKDGRKSSGGNYVPTDISGVKAMVKALRNGEMVGLLPDQVPAQGGILAPFFNHPALTISLLSTLAAKTDATVVFGYAERLPWAKGFHLQFLPPDRLISSTPPEESATRINSQIEACIRKAPDQYLWMYKRFQKNGEQFYDR